MFLDIRYNKLNCLDVGDLLKTSSKKLVLITNIALDLTELENGEITENITFSENGDITTLEFNDFLDFIFSG